MSRGRRRDCPDVLARVSPDTEEARRSRLALVILLVSQLFVVEVLCYNNFIITV